jgi:magnesium transporter
LSRTPIYFEALKVLSRSKCFAKSPTTAEDFVGDYESLNVSDDDDGSDSNSSDGDNGGGRDDSKKIDSSSSSSSSDSTSLGIREPVYEVVEVKATGAISTRKINRRQLLKSSGLRPRDIRSVDPSLFMTNSVPSLLVREHAILLNLGSLRAIAMRDRVLIFDYNRRGGRAFVDTLMPRLNPRSMNGGPSMPFELEAVESALISRIQRLEQRLMDIEPRVSMKS